MVPALKSLQSVSEPALVFPEHLQEILGLTVGQQRVLPAAPCSCPGGRQLWWACSACLCLAARLELCHEQQLPPAPALSCASLSSSAPSTWGRLVSLECLRTQRGGGQGLTSVPGFSRNQFLWALQSFSLRVFELSYSN